jgi:FkbM family methyltransferase
MIQTATANTLRNELKNRTGNTVHEREFIELLSLESIISGCSSFVDVGASRGPYTWAANLALKDAKFTAVEANPALCEHLQVQWRDIKENGNDHGNTLEVINAALSDENGVLNFYINREDYHTSYIGDIMDRQSDSTTHERIEINAVSLDTLFATDPPDFIKIDIEGAEWRAINGARKIMSKRQTRFLIEIHPWGDKSNNKKPSDVFSIMDQSNYTARRFNQHWLFIPVEPCLMDRLKCKFYGFVLDRPWLRKIAKAILLRR